MAMGILEVRIAQFIIMTRKLLANLHYYIAIYLGNSVDEKFFKI